MVGDYKVDDVIDTILPDVAESLGIPSGGNSDSTGTETLPVEVKNIVVYDLKIVNQETGEKVELPDNVKVGIYLPYPAGYDVNSDVAWSLKHYTEDFSSFTQVPLIKTAKGLYFETSGFSPFVLSWEVKSEPVANVPNVPQTGDTTPIGMLVVLMITALGAMLLLRRKAA